VKERDMRRKTWPKLVRRRGSLRRAGFTIVEVLVVVIIIGVLATLIVPRLFGRVGQAKSGVAKSKITQIENAVEMFSNDYDRLPETLDDLVARPSDIPEEKWKEPSLRAKDLIDPWGRSFLYKCPGDHGRFDLYSLGADGQPGGEKDNADITNWE
jgi:general secretion pathway protein G